MNHIILDKNQGVTTERIKQVKKHKWENNVCVFCGLKRKLRTWKLHMAMVGSRDYYKYGRSMAYDVDGKWTFERPDCER